MFGSTKLAVLFNNPSELATILIHNPRKIGAKRVAMLLEATKSDDKTLRHKARFALKMCAWANKRHNVIMNGETILKDRVFNKASNARLAFWAQDMNTPV